MYEQRKREAEKRQISGKKAGKGKMKGRKRRKAKREI